MGDGARRPVYADDLPYVGVRGARLYEALSYRNRPNSNRHDQPPDAPVPDQSGPGRSFRIRITLRLIARNHRARSFAGINRRGGRDPTAERLTADELKRRDVGHLNRTASALTVRDRCRRTASAVTSRHSSG